MEASSTGTATFKIKETGEIIEVLADELDWQSEGCGEGPMGEENRYYAEYEFDSPTTHKSYIVAWELYEYPEGMEDTNQTVYDENKLELLQDLQYGLYHAPERGDED